MHRLKKIVLLGTLVICFAGTARVFGQASPTATQALTLSAFGGFTGTYTGVGLGRDGAFTVGADATIRSFFGIYPGLEIRGTYPYLHGSVDYQKNILGGLTFARHLGRLQPYGDLLIGRGQINYVQPYPNPAFTEVYLQTASAVISPGAGVNFQLRDHIGLKADFQFQRYEAPVTQSGSVYSKAFTFGAIYRFGFGGPGRR